MKVFVTIILFFLVAVTGIKVGDTGASTPAAAVKVCIVQNTINTLESSVTNDAFVSLDRDKRIADMEVADGRNLAHRISASAERMYRFSSIETFQFIKTLLRRMALRIANLANCHTRVYDTSRSLSWDTACEHYIFGMRRILI